MGDLGKMPELLVLKPKIIAAAGANHFFSLVIAIEKTV